MLGLEALGLLAVSLVFGGRAIFGRPHDRPTALFAAGLGVLGALVLVLIARGVRRQRRRVLSLVLLTQLLTLPVGWGMVSGRQYLTGLVVLCLGLGVLGLLFGSASARRAFRR